MNALGGLVTVLLLVVLGLWYFTRRMASLVETRIPPLGRFADVAGARLHYVDRGEAKDQLPIVMLHGLGGQLHHFNYGLVEALAGDTRVIAIDRPGSGYSERIADQATTLFEQAAAIDALLTQLGIGRTLLVGHSLGGALSLTMALQYPQRIAGVALIAPLTHLVDTPPPVFRGIAIRGDLARRAVATLLATPLFLANRERVMPQIFGPEEPPAGYATRGGGLLTLRPSQYMGASADLGALAGVLPQIESRYDELNRPDAPTLDMLYGREDRLLDFRVQGEGFVARVPRCQLQLVTGGHMLPLTQVVLCTQFIRGAWQRARAAAATAATTAAAETDA